MSYLTAKQIKVTFSEILNLAYYHKNKIPFFQKGILFLHSYMIARIRLRNHRM